MTEVVDIAGVAVTLVDTAGLRATAADAVEEEGIARAHAARRVADLTSSCSIARSRSAPTITRSSRSPRQTPRIVVANKSDLEPGWPAGACGDVEILPVSAMTGAGIDALRGAVTAGLAGHERMRDTPAVTNIRHADLLARAAEALRRAAAAAAAGTPEEFVAADVSEARGRLEEITGARTSDDVLHAIFDQVLYWKVIVSADNFASGRVRRHRHRRRARRRGGGLGGGAARPPRRDLHAVGRHDRPHAVQSGRRRNREGASRPRDRRAGRPDGTRDRRHGHPVQAAQPEPRPGGVVAARAGRQAPL